MIDGNSNSTDGDVNNPADTAGGSLIIKLNSITGETMWIKNYTQPTMRAGFGVFATRDGGIVETGTGGGNDNDGYNVLVAKLDRNGNQEWYKLLGGSDFDLGIAGYETRHGDLDILAQTASTDGDIKKSYGGLDTWLLKFGSCGNCIANNDMSSGDVNAAIKNNIRTLSAYPNPVSNSTTISFNLSQTGKAMPAGKQQVSLTIYDMNGRLIKTLVNGQMQQGPHQIIWNIQDEKGNAVASGIYLLKIQTGNYTETKKISVIKQHVP